MDPGIINLIIIGIAAIIIQIAKTAYANDHGIDQFVPNVPLPPGNQNQMLPQLNPQNITNSVHQKVQMAQRSPENYYQLPSTPHQFVKQIYPAKYPYANESGNQCIEGSQTYGCGAAGECRNGVCQPRTYNRTVFNIPTQS